MHDRGVQEPEYRSLLPYGLALFQQDPEQDQEWIFLIGIEPGAGVIFNQSFKDINVYLHFTRFVTRVQQS